MSLQNRQRRLNNGRATVLVAALWLMTIGVLLTAAAVRQARAYLTAVKYCLARQQTQALLDSALVYARAQIRLSNHDRKGRGQDTMYRCGFVLREGVTPRELWCRVRLGSGYFSLTRPVEGRAGRCGLDDEESRLNINAVTPGDGPVFVELLVAAGADRAAATNLVRNLLPCGTNQTDSAPGPCRRRPVRRLENLLAFPGMTETVWRNVRPYLTVYPSEHARLTVNFDTAPAPVLRALLRGLTGPRTHTDRADADALLEKILICRNGEDGVPATGDDRVPDEAACAFNASERALFRTAAAYRTRISRYLRLHARAYVPPVSLQAGFDAVVDRTTLRVLDYRRENL